MNVTHYLELHPYEKDFPRVECLCDRKSGFDIIWQILKYNKGEQFFITFYTVHDHMDEKITGFETKGSRSYC